jgi:alkanesulfonate monooxygenase SsuD/methylene tetrahydromethanopterin reductase-like flavin-dependent oxidoreductase (luciferase family)
LGRKVSHRQLFEDLTELTLMAEAGGFSTVWIGEHHAMEYTISPSPMPLLAYLAATHHHHPPGRRHHHRAVLAPDPGGR